MRKLKRYRTKKPITLSVEPETIAALRQLAEENTAGNISAYVRKLIKRQMEELKVRDEELEELFARMS
jgi:hypothetical protein